MIFARGQNRRIDEDDHAIKSMRNYHDSIRPTSILGLLLGSVSISSCLTTAKADELDILTGGELQYGLAIAREEQLSDGEGDRGYTFFTDAELYFRGDVSPTEDVTIGANVVLNANADIEDINADETYVFAEGTFGLMQLGRTEGAEDKMALGADSIAAGTGGIDGDAANLGEVAIANSEDATKVSYYTPRLFGIQAGLSFTPDTGDGEGAQNDSDEDEDPEDLQDHIGIGLNVVGELGNVEFGLATVGSYGASQDPERNDQDGFSVGGILEFVDVALGASYGWNMAEEDFDFATLGGTLDIGEASLGIGYNYLDEKALGVTHVIAISSDIEFLEGVELQADISYADPEGQDNNLASVVALELSF